MCVIWNVPARHWRAMLEGPANIDLDTLLPASASHPLPAAAACRHPPASAPRIQPFPRQHRTLVHLEEGGLLLHAHAYTHTSAGIRQSTAKAYRTHALAGPHWAQLPVSGLSLGVKI